MKGVSVSQLPEILDSDISEEDLFLVVDHETNRSKSIKLGQIIKKLDSPIDTDLLITSTNPVQNKVITENIKLIWKFLGYEVITNVSDLIQLREEVNAGDTKEGIAYLQIYDVDMQGMTWDGIGTSTNPFKGIYDGYGKVIKNFKLRRETYQGIFKFIAGTESNKCIIKNLTVEVDGIDMSSSESDSYGGAAIVGKSNNGYIELFNLTAKGYLGTTDQPSTHNTAGIITRVDGTSTSILADIHDCVSYVDQVNNGLSETKCGGIIGYVNNYTKIANCSNYGNLYYIGDNATNYDQYKGMGGIAGVSSASAGGHGC
jgi:hypothetical protein